MSQALLTPDPSLFLPLLDLLINKTFAIPSMQAMECLQTWNRRKKVIVSESRTSHSPDVDDMTEMRSCASASE